MNTNPTPATTTAEDAQEVAAVRAPVAVATSDAERAAFRAAHKHLDLTETDDAWGRPMFAHSHVDAMWSGWQAARTTATALPIDFKQATDQGGWQPIATAPQSGKDILLFWRTAGVALGRFTYDEHFDERPRGWKSPEFGWRCDGDQMIPRNQKDCTHWMPLPAAPTLLGVADGDAVGGTSGGDA